MLRYKTESRPGLVILYDTRPGNGAGQFLQPWSPHGAVSHRILLDVMERLNNILLRTNSTTKMTGDLLMNSSNNDSVPMGAEKSFVVYFGNANNGLS